MAVSSRSSVRPVSGCSWSERPLRVTAEDHRLPVTGALGLFVLVEQVRERFIAKSIFD
jgi:hypothetical protein